MIVVLIVDQMANATACRQQLTYTSHCEPSNSMARNMSPVVRCVLLSTELARGVLTEVGSELIP